MLVRAVFIWMGCVIAWLIVMPVIAIVGGAALFSYALLAEITVELTGTTPRPVDPSTIRLTARRICAGYSFSRT